VVSRSTGAQDSRTFIRPDFSPFSKSAHALLKNGATIGSHETDLHPQAQAEVRVVRQAGASSGAVGPAFENYNFAKRTGVQPNLFDFTSIPSHTRPAPPPAAPTRISDPFH
jgi:hypothetical protein